MRLTTTSAALVSLAALTAATTFSEKSDLDGSVWQDLTPVKGRSITHHRRNRPVKRQSGWSPPSDMSGALKEVWDHCEETYNNGDLYAFKNYGWDQIMATSGTINMCVRWESSESVTEAQRTKIASAVSAQYQKWFEWVYGYDNFPFDKISVNVVGWAVKDTSLLQGSTDGIDVYTDTDTDGIPMCASACNRMDHQDGDYSGCTGGEDHHFDQSLWLTDGISGGTGGDWGQRIGREYFMELLDSEDIHILLHEMGHTFGLDDFYDWTPTGQSSFIMLAGSATKITDFDGWMFRNWWYELSRNRGWQDGTTSESPATSAAASPAQTTQAPVEAAESDSPEITSIDIVPSVPGETPTPEEPTTTPGAGAGAPDSPEITSIDIVPSVPGETPTPEEPTTTPGAGAPEGPGNTVPFPTDIAPTPPSEDPIATPAPEEPPVKSPPGGGSGFATSIRCPSSGFNFGNRQGGNQGGQSGQNKW